MIGHGSRWGWSILLLIGCSSASLEKPSPLTLATTTSTRDSGLLEALIPPFERQTGIKVKVIAVGTGQALELGRRGDADVLLTHAPEAEQAFVLAGDGIERRPVMHNDFVLVGPPDDPANLRAQRNLVGAFEQLSQRGTTFVSRGDQSGTHLKEQRIWRAAQIVPKGDWYWEAGGGMAETLRVAQEKQAYALTDRGTFLAQRSPGNLKILFEGDALLHNPYAVILINPAKHPHVNHQAARQFADYLTSEPAQTLIGEFGVKTFGQPLFFPKSAPVLAP